MKRGLAVRRTNRIPSVKHLPVDQHMFCALAAGKAFSGGCGSRPGVVRYAREYRRI